MKSSKTTPKDRARPRLLVGERSSIAQLTEALRKGSTPRATAALKPILDELVLKID